MVSGAAWRGCRTVTPEQFNKLTGGFESHRDRNNGGACSKALAINTCNVCEEGSIPFASTIKIYSSNKRVTS